MTQKRNKIAIAPTYTIINIKAKNSHSNKKSKNEPQIKQNIKNKIEKIGWFTITIIIALNTRPNKSK
jgi:hypothetical protein